VVQAPTNLQDNPIDAKDQCLCKSKTSQKYELTVPEKIKKQRSHQISFCIALWGFENIANVEGNSLYANLAKS
jgi:hypothetical protein